MLIAKYNLRSLFARKTTAVATALGVALATLVFAASWMLAAGVTKTLGEGGRDDTAVVLRKGSDAELNSSFDAQVLGLLLSAPGVKSEGGAPLGAAETVVVAAVPKVGAAGMSNVTLRGVDPPSYALRSDLVIVEGQKPRPGTDEAIIGARLRGRFEGLDLGKSFELRKNRPVTIVGVFEDRGHASESEVWIDRAVLSAAFGRTATVSSVHVRLTDKSQFAAFESAVEHDKRLALDAIEEPVFLEHQSEGLSLFLRVMGTLIGVFFSLGAMLGATMTMHAAVANREREIGTLRALGFPKRQILAGFLVEAMTLTAAGGAVGVLLSTCLSRVKISMINYATWSELVFTFSPTTEILVKAVVFAALMGLVGGFFPAYRASRISPLAALKS
ncbi:ABC transporter permease [Pendulispora rubella]|uniref:ABC transporter permease n=1 Tax=Pendulispora rubella TaxID=2741070 RepID=A0ABZ2LGF9_9BACT